MDKVKKVVGRDKDGKTDDEAGIIERAKETSTMSCGTRMKAFVVCFCLGVLMCFLGVSMLWLPGLGISIFAAFYTAGNVFALLSITFLVGPCKQLKSMCAIERAFATILMLAFMVLTVLGTFWWKIITLSLIFCACQFLAFTWYALSYVPFARECLLKCCRCCCTV
ncbi:vesicle transport protein SFT2A-like isoform X2 [Takifugu flavidus]|uniref:vesicle transport protein SFT2A-like isoform X2 n=1 Tax=Takifugu flavidus TaxID=433684 RepID=UPI0025445C70|nr:vesicle transport protein SFT2A-like isoform X2 [Takifugu flavidus]